jgi:predicted Fe-S protein YdhL (DUF1289 family)
MLNREQICTGCGRRLSEIAEWPEASEARRGQIREQAANRIRDLAR